jgi:hypothetical protein
VIWDIVVLLDEASLTTCRRSEQILYGISLVDLVEDSIVVIYVLKVKPYIEYTADDANAHPEERGPEVTMG